MKIPTFLTLTAPWRLQVYIDTPFASLVSFFGAYFPSMQFPRGSGFKLPSNFATFFASLYSQVPIEAPEVCQSSRGCAHLPSRG